MERTDDGVRWDRVAAARKRLAEGYYDRPEVIRLGLLNLLRELTTECRRGEIARDETRSDHDG